MISRRVFPSPSAEHGGPRRHHQTGLLTSHALSHAYHQHRGRTWTTGPHLRERPQPRPHDPQKPLSPTCAMWDRHSSRRMATSARGHGERIIALRQQRAGIGVQGGIGRWLCHTRVRADASRRHPPFLSFSVPTAEWHRAATQSEGPHRSRSGRFPGQQSCQSRDGRCLRWSAMRCLCTTSRPRTSWCRTHRRSWVSSRHPKKGA